MEDADIFRKLSVFHMIGTCLLKVNGNTFKVKEITDYACPYIS